VGVPTGETGAGAGCGVNVAVGGGGCVGGGTGVLVGGTGVLVGRGVSVTGGVSVADGSGVAVAGIGVNVKVGIGVLVGRGGATWATGVLVAQASDVKTRMAGNQTRPLRKIFILSEMIVGGISYRLQKLADLRGRYSSTNAI
jgi:hypothetical protein